MPRTRRSFFRRARSINPTDLCESIGDEIFKLNSSVKTQESLSKLVGTPKDNADLRNKINKLQSALKTDISSLTITIKELKRKTPLGDKVLQLQAEKFKETLFAALNKYETVQKDLANKQKSHILVTVDLERPSSDYERIQVAQRQSQIIAELKSKQECLSNIQTDIVDIHAVMGELGAMVEQQGESVDKVGENISEVAGNVERRAKDQSDALDRKKRSRKSAVYLLSLVILVTVLVLVFVLYNQLG